MAKKMNPALGNDREPEPTSASEQVSMDESDRAVADARERIAARAYELFQERGGHHGRDTDDWLEAEREVSRPFDRPTDE